MFFLQKYCKNRTLEFYHIFIKMSSACHLTQSGSLCKMFEKFTCRRHISHFYFPSRHESKSCFSVRRCVAARAMPTDRVE